MNTKIVVGSRFNGVATFFASHYVVFIAATVFTASAVAATCPETDEIHLQSAPTKTPAHYVTESGWVSAEATTTAGSNIQFDRVLIGFSQQQSEVTSDVTSDLSTELTKGDIHACTYTLEDGDTPYNVIHMLAPTGSSATLGNVSEWLDISIPGIVDMPASTVYICPSAKRHPSVTHCEFTLADVSS